MGYARGKNPASHAHHSKTVSRSTVKSALAKAGVRVPKGFAKGAQARANAAGFGEARKALMKLARAETAAFYKKFGSK